MFYLIKWAGFPEFRNSYEPKENILHQELIDDFMKEFKKGRGLKGRAVRV